MNPVFLHYFRFGLKENVTCVEIMDSYAKLIHLMRDQSKEVIDLVPIQSESALAFYNIHSEFTSPIPNLSLITAIWTTANARRILYEYMEKVSIINGKYNFENILYFGKNDVKY